MLRADRLLPDRALALVIDLQEKLLPFIEGQERVVEASRQLIEGVAIFDVPVLATEQYPKGIGPTHPAVLRALKNVEAEILEKPTFSACGHDPIRQAMNRMDRSQVLLVGIEAHVCVQQTALDLRAMDYDVFVCADAVGSRGTMSASVALERMRQAGVFITTVESALFELCQRCDTERFRKMIDLVKRHPPA